MTPKEVKEHREPETLLGECLSRIQKSGPNDPKDFEMLALIKLFHVEAFKKYQARIVCSLGLFYKTDVPRDMLSLAYSIWKEAIREEHEEILTPLQCGIKNGINNHIYYSFSAPTSAGKSHLFRKLIEKATDDIVIIVPSRALISEYTIRIRELLRGNSTILILNFADDINRLKTKRRVFVLTPERAVDLFRMQEQTSVGIFLFDEAQLADADGNRGINFDSVVRRANKVFPRSKKVFAHPFVANPEAQFVRNKIQENHSSKCFPYHAVGKVFYSVKNDEFSIFSPYIERGDLKKNRLILDSDPLTKILSDGGSALIYVSKNSIYDGSFLKNFKKYIDSCQPIENQEALDIVELIIESIAAKQQQSNMIDLMRRGIVIHHGSIPLSVRFLIEQFVNKGFARLCFATSTLAQGVNMPFDVVWIENMRFYGSDEDKPLALKNLIGRAGRTTMQTDIFDHGIVITDNAKKLSEMISCEVRISGESRLDAPPNEEPDDLTELLEAIKNENMNDEYNLPITKLERLASEQMVGVIKGLLDKLFRNGGLLKGNEYRTLPKGDRQNIKEGFRKVFEASLDRELEKGEKTVLSVAVQILLWQLQGKSFKEILGLRSAYVTGKDQQREINREFRQEIITKENRDRRIRKIPLKGSAIPFTLPNKSLKTVPSQFFGETVGDFNYDRLVYDTYDYLDKVISFSLSDVYIAAFGQYYKSTNDQRASSMVKYLRYGTNDDTEILLIRYGFTFDDIELVMKYVMSINEEGIVFKDSIKSLRELPVYALIERYL